MSKTFRFNKKEYDNYSSESKKSKNFRKQRADKHLKDENDIVNDLYFQIPKKVRKHYIDER